MESSEKIREGISLPKYPKTPLILVKKLATIELFVGFNVQYQIANIYVVGQLTLKELVFEVLTSIMLILVYYCHKGIV